MEDSKPDKNTSSDDNSWNVQSQFMIAALISIAGICAVFDYSFWWVPVGFFPALLAGRIIHKLLPG